MNQPTLKEVIASIKTDQPSPFALTDEQKEFLIAFFSRSARPPLHPPVSQNQVPPVGEDRT